MTRAPTLFDRSGRAVGIVTLVRSVNCSTVWARVILTRKLKDDTINIIIERPGDSVRVPFSIALGAANVAYGSMLSDAQSCVRAEVSLRPNDAIRNGPYSITPCVIQN
jgi:hypothetical protein